MGAQSKVIPLTTSTLDTEIYAELERRVERMRNADPHLDKKKPPMSTLNDVYVEVVDKAKTEREKFRSVEMTRILEKYDVEVPEYKASEICRAEEEIAKCESCQGLPCKRGASTRPFIFVEKDAKGKIDVTVRYAMCKFQRAAIKKAQFNKRFKAAKIPLQYTGKSFSDYKITRYNAAAVKAAKEFLQGDKGGLFLYGNPGTGKTFLAAILAQEVLKSDKSVIFGDVPTLLEILRGTFDDKSTKITDLMDDLSTVDLLVLDDLGTESPTEWAVERLYTIVNDRYNAEKPVIVTSNFMLGDLSERLNHPKNARENSPNVTGSRIVSRLAQMCNRVELTGEDWRF